MKLIIYCGWTDLIQDLLKFLDKYPNNNRSIPDAKKKIKLDVFIKKCMILYVLIHISLL